MLRNVVLFQGTGADGQTGLWETNGTASGTFELAPIVGASGSGVSPSDVTAFNGEALFAGNGGIGTGIVLGLWSTDGTAAGTVALMGRLRSGK